MAPAAPRPAASLILLRHGGRHSERGTEVLMLRRSPEASFMPGVWVFPGGAVDPVDETGDEDEEGTHRACAARELAEEAGIALPVNAELLPWSRWITPEAVPVRFDTRFYVALSPAHAPPRADGVEMTDAAWLSPAHALERHREGDLPLAFPTIRHLESLLPFERAEEVLEAARSSTVEPILPKVVGEGERRRVVLPGEPDYPA